LDFFYPFARRRAPSAPAAIADSFLVKFAAPADRWHSRRSGRRPPPPARSYGVGVDSTPASTSAWNLHAPLLFLTSRIPETEAYRSDRFEVGFGFATP
jgi:hypothetical protein